MTGILKALGCRDWTIQKIFLYHANMIALRGIIIGLITGLGICLLQQYTGFIKMNEAAYYVSEAPVFIIWWQVIAICVATLLVLFSCFAYSTWLVKTIRPVKAIQFR